MKLSNPFNGMLSLVGTEFKLYLREPSAFFFTLIFPLLMMLLFGSIWGNDPFPGTVYGYIDFSTSSFIGLVALTSGFMHLTINIATYREKGILKRFKAAPVSPVAFLAAHLTAMMVISFAGVLLLLAAGVIIFDMQFMGSVSEAVLAFLLGCCGIAGMGFIPASLVSTARSGTVIANFIYFPMMFLSGAALPRSMLPEILQRVSDFLPLTHMIELMRGIWLGESLLSMPVEIAVLAGTAIVGGVVSTLFFRWD